MNCDTVSNSAFLIDDKENALGTFAFFVFDDRRWMPVG